MKYLKLFENYKPVFVEVQINYSDIRSYINAMDDNFGYMFDDINMKIKDFFNESKEMRQHLRDEYQTYINQQPSIEDFTDYITSSLDGHQEIYYHPYGDAYYLDILLDIKPDFLDEVIDHHEHNISEGIPEEIKKKYDHLFDADDLGLI